MRRKESRQQEQTNMLFQMAMTGMMAYFGLNKKRSNNNDGKPPTI